MRQRLIYILKHNSFLQTVYKVCMSFVFRLLGLFVPTDDKLILFSSFMGSKFNDSPKCIYEYIKSNSDYEEYRCIWAFEKPEDYPALNTVKIDTPAYFYTALKAKFWVTNTNIERGLTFKKNHQIYLNTWHGIALKKIGNDCPGRKDYNFKTVNYLCVSGRYDEKVFKTAFWASEQNYLRCGMPRNDRLWASANQDRIQMRKKLGIPSNKKAILYAPTWRESTDGGKSYVIEPPIDFDFWKNEIGDKYVLLFRAHHLTTKALNVQFNDFIWNVSEYPDVNDLMIASDLLITDYSAIAFDYSILCRPIFCFAYDYETYLKERGTYFDMDECYPNPSCRSEAELLQRIQHLDALAECERTRTFRDRFVEFHENAAKECAEHLLGGDSSIPHRAGAFSNGGEENA